MRARDLIEMIGSPALIPLAAKYANKLGRIHLAEKLSEMLPRVLEMEREKEREVMDVEYVEEAPSVSHVSVIQSSSSSMPSPVVVAPKLIKPGAGKRNPFKRGAGAPSSASSSPNPIKHLTDSIVGLPSNDSFGSRSSIGGGGVERGGGDADTLVVATTTTPNGNVDTSGKSPARKPFFEWFTEQRTQLQAEMPEGSNPAELTSFAMKRYKQINANGGAAEPATSTAASAKRKLDEKEKENAGSGIAKLAKFRVET